MREITQSLHKKHTQPLIFLKNYTIVTYLHTYLPTYLSTYLPECSDCSDSSDSRDKNHATSPLEKSCNTYLPSYLPAYLTVVTLVTLGTVGTVVTIVSSDTNHATFPQKKS